MPGYAKPATIRLGAVEMDTETGLLKVNGVPRAIRTNAARKVTRILAAMMKAPGIVFTREALVGIAGSWAVTSDKIADVYVSDIRRSLGDALVIWNEWGTGWSMHPVGDAPERKLRRHGAS